MGRRTKAEVHESARHAKDYIRRDLTEEDLAEWADRLQSDIHSKGMGYLDSRHLAVAQLLRYLGYDFELDAAEPLPIEHAVNLKQCREKQRESLRRRLGLELSEAAHIYPQGHMVFRVGTQLYKVEGDVFGEWERISVQDQATHIWHTVEPRNE